MDIRIGIAGLGTIGSGVVELIRENALVIREKTGVSLSVVAIAEPAIDSRPDFDRTGIRIYKDGMDLVSDPAVDILVELVGGVAFPKKLVLAALENGKHVVTANKALLAKEGQEIYQTAARKQLALGIEASVAGGIPVIKTIREALVGNRILEIRGIINGTCNYILTRMAEHGLSFAAALAEAQARWEQDNAVAARARQQTEQAAAVDRARAEAYRRGAWDAYPVYPYGSLYYGRPFGHPYARPGHPWGRGGINWGIRIGR